MRAPGLGMGHSPDSLFRPEVAEAVSYTYDALGRLTATSGTGTAVITYTITDSLGATATRAFTLNVIQGQC